MQSVMRDEAASLSPTSDTMPDLLTAKLMPKSTDPFFNVLENPTMKVTVALKIENPEIPDQNSIDSLPSHLSQACDNAENNGETGSTSPSDGSQSSTSPSSSEGHSSEGEPPSCCPVVVPSSYDDPSHVTNGVHLDNDDDEEMGLEEEPPDRETSLYPRQRNDYQPMGFALNGSGGGSGGAGGVMLLQHTSPGTYDDTLLFRLLESAESGANSRPHSIYHQPPKAADHEAAKRLAKRLYYLEGFKMRDVAKHLIKRNEFSQLVGEEYLNFFDFTGATLDQAVREFLSKFILLGETSDRERILQFFSRRYCQCNTTAYASEAACHYLTCALMLLNADLHSQIPRKMSCSEFIANLALRNDGNNFAREELRDLYNSIKNEPIQWPSEYEVDGMPAAAMHNPLHHDPNYQLMVGGSPLLTSHQGGQLPYFQTNLQKEGREFMRGFLSRKCVMESHGKKVRKLRRGWKSFYARLKGLNLFLYRAEDSQKFESVFHEMNQWPSSSPGAGSGTALPQTPPGHPAHLHNSTGSMPPNGEGDNATNTPGNSASSSSSASTTVHSSFSTSSVSNSTAGRDNSLPEAEHCIMLHHSFTWKDPNYTKKPNVFRMRTHNGAEYLFNTYQAVNGSVEMENWIVQLNYSAALLSPPFMSCPVGSQKGFHRPSYPLHYTPANDVRQQYECQFNQLSACSKDLSAHEQNPPIKATKAKKRAEFEEKQQFLISEIDRLRLYMRLLAIHLNGWDRNAAVQICNGGKPSHQDLQRQFPAMLFPVGGAGGGGLGPTNNGASGAFSVGDKFSIHPGEMAITTIGGPGPTPPTPPTPAAASATTASSPSQNFLSETHTVYDVI